MYDNGEVFQEANLGRINLKEWQLFVEREHLLKGTTTYKKVSPLLWTGHITLDTQLSVLMQGVIGVFTHPCYLMDTLGP